MIELVGGIIAEAVGTTITGLFSKVIRPFLRLIFCVTLVLVITLPLAYWYFS